MTRCPDRGLKPFMCSSENVVRTVISIGLPSPTASSQPGGALPTAHSVRRQGDGEQAFRIADGSTVAPPASPVCAKVKARVDPPKGDGTARGFRSGIHREMWSAVTAGIWVRKTLGPPSIQASWNSVNRRAEDGGRTRGCGSSRRASSTTAKARQRDRPPTAAPRRALGLVPSVISAQSAKVKRATFVRIRFSNRTMRDPHAP